MRFSDFIRWCLIANCLLNVHTSAAAKSQRTLTPSDSSRQTLEDTKKQFLTALKAYQEQRYSEALSTLTPLAKANPGIFEVNELLGLVYVAQGQDLRANPFLRRAVDLQPRTVEARTALATSLLRLHRNRDAELQFKKAVELEPRSYDTNHNLGEFYVQLGRLADAIVFLKRAQAANPSAENNGYDLALAYEEQGSLEEARREVQKLMAFHDSAELHSLLGEIEEKSKNFLASAKQYEQAARIDPNEQNIFDWGTELLLHQTFEPAVELFKAGLARFPQSIRLQIGLGIALYGLDRFDEAASAFLQAADMNPSDSLPLTFLARAYGNLSPALGTQVLTLLRVFLDKHKGDASLRYDYAMCLWKLNEKEPSAELSEQIESLLKTVIAMDPAYADAYLQLGILRASKGEYQAAIGNYKQALELNSSLPSLHYRLGQALARIGETRASREELAIFERLRQTQAEEGKKQNQEIKQFVYTMRNSGVGKARSSEISTPALADSPR